MAGVDGSKVLVGAPEQSGVAGAISMAPVGTELPKTARDDVDSAFKSSGYVSNEGVNVTPTLNTTEVVDWNGDVIRTLLESFTGTVNFSLIQFDGASAKMVFGDDNVSETPATSMTGAQVNVSIGASLPAAKSWVFRMKDGDNLIRVVLPNAQVTDWAELTFAKNTPIPLPATLTCNADESGKSIYIYTDDGVFSE